MDDLISRQEAIQNFCREYPADVLRHRGIYCSSRKRIQWCKKYLNRIYRRRSKTEEDE